MADIIDRQHVWVDAAPVHGEQVYSHWEQIPQARLLNPWRGWLRFTGGKTHHIVGADPVLIGFTQDAEGDALACDLEFQPYRQSFGWADEHGLDGPMCNYTGHLQETAKQIIRFCRTSTFPSFRHSKLGITLEFSAALWQPDEHQNPADHDVVPHQDWVRQDVPVVLALASKTYDPRDCDVFPRQLNTAMWEGSYTYEGDLQDDQGDTINYVEAVKAMEPIGAARSLGSIWVADARRGLHGRPPMQPREEPAVRLFMRSFIAPI